MNQNMLICQSCSMPMMKSEDFGKNTDGSLSQEYCTYCFQSGDFTWSGTLDQMIEKLVSMHDRMGISEADARKMANNNLPKLRRWAK